MRETPPEGQDNERKEPAVRENQAERREGATELIGLLLNRPQRIKIMSLEDGTLLNRGQALSTEMELRVAAHSIPTELYLATAKEERWTLFEKLGDSRLYNVTVEAVSQKENGAWEFVGGAQLDPGSVGGTLREERDYSLRLLVRGEYSTQGDSAGNIGQESWLEIMGITGE